MKMPKGFNKMTAKDQESWLVKKLQEVYAVETELRKLLGAVRGGQRVSIPEIDRPDEAILKDPA
jgi:hypothetical protein